MAIQVDVNHLWRSTSLSDIPVCVLDFSINDPPAPNHTGGASDQSSWPEFHERAGVNESVAREGYRLRSINTHYEVLDLKKEADSSGCVATRRQVPYDYFTKATVGVVTSDGDHYSVVPSINLATSQVLRNAQSVEEVARVAGIKLPRVVTSSSQRSSIDPLMDDNAPPDFEQLRGLVLTAAQNSDYGLRLFQLARIVCHATVLAESAMLPGDTSAMQVGGCRSILTSAAPMITSAGFIANSFHYIGSELNPMYRAFLLMGARGLENYSSVNTVYSQFRTGPEVTLSHDSQVVFVRVGNSLANANPPGQSYRSVLSSPDLCYAYYMAYANSLGLKEEAAVVLQQVAVMPHLCGDTARLPYKPQYPRLDAAPYLFSDTFTNATAGVADIRLLVGNAKLDALRIQVGLGARITCFANGSKTNHAEVMTQTIQSLTAYETTRLYMKEVLACCGGAQTGLHWVSPFHPGFQAGFASCVAAFRTHTWILSQNLTPVCSALSPIFSGTDMRRAVFGASSSSGKYSELVLMQLAAGLPTALLCDTMTQASLPSATQRSLGYMRSWLAKCLWVKYSANGGGDAVKKSVPTHRKASSDTGVRPIFLQPSIPPTTQSVTGVTESTVKQELRAASPASVASAPAGGHAAADRRASVVRDRAGSVTRAGHIANLNKMSDGEIHRRMASVVMMNQAATVVEASSEESSDEEEEPVPPDKTSNSDEASTIVTHGHHRL